MGVPIDRLLEVAQDEVDIRRTLVSLVDNHCADRAQSAFAEPVDHRPVCDVDELACIVVRSIATDLEADREAGTDAPGAGHHRTNETCHACRRLHAWLGHDNRSKLRQGDRGIIWRIKQTVWHVRGLAGAGARLHNEDASLAVREVVQDRVDVPLVHPEAELAQIDPFDVGDLVGRWHRAETTEGARWPIVVVRADGLADGLQVDVGHCHALDVHSVALTMTLAPIGSGLPTI